MTLKLEDFEGVRFGRMVVVSLEAVYHQTPDGKRREVICQCVCDCGNNKEIRLTALRSGTQSCGCLGRERRSAATKQHGLSGTRTYTVWYDMMSRCTKPQHRSYSNYGGRGIDVCSRWLESDGKGFLNFLYDMGEVPEGHSIERKDVSCGYSPDNCIWTGDTSLQSYNTRLRKRNSTGKTGVYQLADKDGNLKWVAHISRGNKRVKKTFTSFEEAAAQRDEWELQFYGFNHTNSA